MFVLIFPEVTGHESAVALQAGWRGVPRTWRKLSVILKDVSTLQKSDLVTEVRARILRHGATVQS